MAKRIAVIGAGPSGLTAAKAALEVGLEPTIFEASTTGMGGLWKKSGGFVWNNMRTNLTKWSCSFSDHPWDEEADDFPFGSALLQYLLGYATRFGLEKRVAFGQRVARLERDGATWQVTTAGSIGAPQSFDGVIVAGGVVRQALHPGVTRTRPLQRHNGCIPASIATVRACTASASPWSAAGFRASTSPAISRRPAPR